MVLNPKFIAQMYKPSVRTPKNLGRMTSEQLRAEYTAQSEVANKRIRALQKSGLYSPTLKNLNENGIERFGIKNQGLVTDADIKKAYRELMGFMNSTTSTRTGVKQTIDKMVQNFNMKFDGNYVEFSRKSQKVFDLYEDLRELSKKGVLKESDKYDIVHDLDTLTESGEIDENTTATQLIERLNELKDVRDSEFRSKQSDLKFNWRVRVKGM